MNDPKVFQFIGETVQNATDAFVQPAAENLMLGLQILVPTCLAIYISLTGYFSMTGAVETPVRTLIKQILKVSIISSFALTAGIYMGWVVAGIQGLESGLAEALSISSTPAATPASIYQILDHSLGKGFEIVMECFRKADEAGYSLGSVLSWWLAGIIVAIGTVLVALLGGGVIIVAKFSLAVLFALGPFFILTLMWPVTARFFDSWFSQVMNYVLTTVIMAFILSFAVKAFDVFIGQANFSGDGEFNPVYSSLQIGALTGVLCWIISQASGMASGLAGGVSSAAMGIRHFLLPATKVMDMGKTAKNVVNGSSTRRDLESGMMVTAGRTNHLIAGNTMWNPAYRQHVISNIGKNWGRASGGSVKGKKS
jgi:type IV secretion system protein VirB6